VYIKAKKITQTQGTFQIVKGFYEKLETLNKQDLLFNGIRILSDE
jgi:hypothetical protein